MNSVVRDPLSQRQRRDGFAQLPFLRKRAIVHLEQIAFSEQHTTPFSRRASPARATHNELSARLATIR